MGKKGRPTRLEQWLRPGIRSEIERELAQAFTLPERPHRRVRRRRRAIAAVKPLPRRRHYGVA